MHPMDLTRYWKASHRTHQIEVQWTGVRLSNGWTLRLLIDGQLQDEKGIRPVERLLKRDMLMEGKAGEEPISVRFRQSLFRNRCSISAGGTVLRDSSQPWNALGFLIVGFGTLMVCLILLQSFRIGIEDGRQERRQSMPK